MKSDPMHVIPEVRRDVHARGLTALLAEDQGDTARGLLRRLCILLLAGHERDVLEVACRLRDAPDAGTLVEIGIDRGGDSHLGILITEQVRQGRHRLMMELLEVLPVPAWWVEVGFRVHWEKLDGDPLLDWLEARARWHPSWVHPLLRQLQHFNRTGRVREILDAHVAVLEKDPSDLRAASRILELTQDLVVAPEIRQRVSAILTPATASDCLEAASHMVTSATDRIRILERALALPLGERERSIYASHFAVRLADPEAHFRLAVRKSLARLLLEVGRTDEAQLHMEATIDATVPARLDLALLAGQTQLRSGMQVLRGRIDEAADADPDDPRTWLAQATYRIGRQEFSAALDVYDRAIARFLPGSERYEIYDGMLELLRLQRKQLGDDAVEARLGQVLSRFPVQYTPTAESDTGEDFRWRVIQQTVNFLHSASREPEALALVRETWERYPPCSSCRDAILPERIRLEPGFSGTEPWFREHLEPVRMWEPHGNPGLPYQTGPMIKAARARARSELGGWLLGLWKAERNGARLSPAAKVNLLTAVVDLLSERPIVHNVFDVEDTLGELAALSIPSEHPTHTASRLEHVSHQASRLLEHLTAISNMDGARRIWPLCLLDVPRHEARGPHRAGLINNVERAAKLGLVDEAFASFRERVLEQDRTETHRLTDLARSHPGMRALLIAYYEDLMQREPDCAVATAAMDILQRTGR